MVAGDENSILTTGSLYWTNIKHGDLIGAEHGNCSGKIKIVTDKYTNFLLKSYNISVLRGRRFRKIRGVERRIENVSLFSDWRTRIIACQLNNSWKIWGAQRSLCTWIRWYDILYQKERSDAADSAGLDDRSALRPGDGVPAVALLNLVSNAQSIW